MCCKIEDSKNPSYRWVLNLLLEIVSGKSRGMWIEGVATRGEKWNTHGNMSPTTLSQVSIEHNMYNYTCPHREYNTIYIYTYVENNSISNLIVIGTFN